MMSPAPLGNPVEKRGVAIGPGAIDARVATAITGTSLLAEGDRGT
jgi:hypothetical protein